MQFFRNLKKSADAELMLRIGKGDQEAFSELYARYSGRLLNFFFRMLDKDLAKAEDFMHDLFLKIIENPGRYDPRRCFDTWVFHIAYNMCKNEYNRMAVRNEYTSSLSKEEPETGERAGDRHDFHRFSEALDVHLNRLDERHRMVFLLRYQQEMPIRGIAEILGCPEGTVKSRLFVAIKTLSGKLNVFDPKIN
ncbi:MAG TPA: sigma-70 family RNA polymerase sigma factor [Bacteroidales bacterium]|mgnify:CR=1 FL=1|nr:sigma-70 family RNA polymerase sigma factor [Bacteroidales bacterium]